MVVHRAARTRGVGRRLAEAFEALVDIYNNLPGHLAELKEVSGVS